jgi:L-threonine-O-3-phosphate decarboxylase
MLEHGGRVRSAAARYGIPVSDWLDLSTGINPQAWPVPALPVQAWQRLPEDDDGLEIAARGHYGAAHLLPVAGTQAALRVLPGLRPSSRVALRSPSYAEHAHAWRRAGHAVEIVGAEDLAQASATCDVLVLVNPNNPTGEVHSPAALLALHSRLAARGGWLVVDEAYIDATPHTSLIEFCDRPGLVVLRSFGKFFGLAGARVGFVAAAADFLLCMSDEMGPWTVSGPARQVAAQALLDVAWQQETRARLMRDSHRLAQLLQAHGLAPGGGCALFQWVRSARAVEWFEALARAGILVRLFQSPASLRFGLPGSEAGWQRLERALARQAERA